MEINILNSSFERIAIIDAYVSLMWCKRYYEIGGLDLEIEATAENLNFFKKGNYITRDDDETIFRIETIELETAEDKNNHLIVGAFDCKKILSQRIIWDTINFKGTVENFIRKIITDNVISPTNSKRKISNFFMTSVKGFTETVEQQSSYNDIGEKIKELCIANNYGWKVDFVNGAFYFDLYKGVNHSIHQSENNHVVFSPEYENIISTKYNSDNSNFKNVALVGGEGEGKDRKTRSVGDYSGLNRYEMFVDAKSSSSNVEGGDLVDYFENLINQGKEKLAEKSVVTSFEGEVESTSYKYKTDYNLGDIVTIQNEYGISVDARITEIVETWNEEGYTLEPIFEYMEVEEPDEIVEGAILTESALMLTSETSQILVQENTNVIKSDCKKISELIETPTLNDGCCFPIIQNGETKRVAFSTIKSNIQPSFYIDSKGHLIAKY